VNLKAGILATFFFVVSFLIFGPAVITPDGRDQLAYAQADEYWDQHPVLLSRVYRLFILCGASAQDTVHIQATLFWLSTSWMSVTSLAFAGLFVPVMPQSFFFTKDVWLTIVLVVVAVSINSRNSKICTVLSGLLLGLTPGIRYNTLPLVLGLLFLFLLFRRKQRILFTCSVILGLFVFYASNTAKKVIHEPEGARQLLSARERLYDETYPNERKGSLFSEYVSHPTRAISVESGRIWRWVSRPSTYTVIPDSDLVAGSVHANSKKVRDALAVWFAPSILTTPLLWFVVSLVALLVSKNLGAFIPLGYLLTLAIGLPYGIEHFRFILPSVVLSLYYIPLDQYVLRLLRHFPYVWKYIQPMGTKKGGE